MRGEKKKSTGLALEAVSGGTARQRRYITEIQAR